MISYENGYRDVRPLGHINPTCWETDSESSLEEEAPKVSNLGLLPLVSEIRY